MKKQRIIVLLLALLLVLCACAEEASQTTEPVTEPTVSAQAQQEAEAQKAKEEAAFKTVHLINAIGNVTVNSADSITAARAAFDALPGDAQLLVANVDVLVEAEKTYTAAKAAEVDALIAAMGEEVTLESAANVNAAWDAYQGSHPDVQLKVGDFETLKLAKDALNALKAAEVDAAIQAIGKVTLKKEAAIAAAEESLAALTAEEAALVTEQQTLQAARAKLTELQKNTLLKKLNTKYDKTQGITWYTSQQEPKLVTSRSYVLPFIGVQEERAWLGLRYHYTGSQWVFFENITVIADGKEFTRSFPYFDVQRGNRSSKVWEWIDVEMSPEDVEMIKTVANSQLTTVRFSGDQYQSEFTVQQADKQAILDMLAAFEYF